MAFPAVTSISIVAAITEDVLHDMVA